MPPANVAANDSLDDRLTALLGELLEEERLRITEVDGVRCEARRDELRGWIEQREAELADEDALDAGFEKYIRGLPDEERPQRAAQIARAYNEWKGQLQADLDRWQADLDELDNRPVDQQAIVRWARIRVESLFHRAVHKSADRATLVELYHATGGDNWKVNTNWLTDAPLDEWYGVTIDADCNVTGLQLNSNDLGSDSYGYPVLQIVGKLQRLKNLQLAYNFQLNCRITGDLARLSNLEHLDLGYILLSGEIPVEFSSLANLRELDLSEGILMGQIPVELGCLANLEKLHLEGCMLTGRVPMELGSLTNLRELNLGSNELTGQIPVELGSLANLHELDLGGNQLTGQIPVELGNLANLCELELWGNQLTGQIPVELGSLSNLQELKLGSNQLTGQIPVELGNLTNLRELELWGNQLTGQIPVELGSLSNLQELELWSNQLTGQIPSELGNLANLHELELWGNQLTGCIPSALRGVSKNDLARLRLPFCEE